MSEQLYYVYKTTARYKVLRSFVAQRTIFALCAYCYLQST